MLNYLVALTCENWVDMSTKPWTNHKSLWPRPHANTANSQSCKHMRSNMADEASAILFIIGLRRAGIENWVKFAILRVRMSLRLCLYASENQALACIVCAWRGLGRVKKKLANSWPARPQQRSQDAFRLASCIFSYAHSLWEASTNSVYSHWLFTCNSSGTMGTTTSTPFLS